LAKKYEQAGRGRQFNGLAGQADLTGSLGKKENDRNGSNTDTDRVLNK
jgi:hypothetical protein